VARDDFTQKTIELLAQRVGYRCSNPSCRQPTRGPQLNRNKTINIGVAAHITAAADGGPRYDKFLTSSERKSIENGIWLCWNCSKLIDNDEERYSVSLLLEWKRLAEKIAHKAVEQPHIDKEDRESTSYVNNVNQFYHVENHHTYHYNQKRAGSRTPRQSSSRSSRSKDVEIRLYNSLLKPLRYAYPFIMGFFVVLVLLSFVTAISEGVPTPILFLPILLCIIAAVALFIAFLFFYESIRLSDFYMIRSVDERLKVKRTLQRRKWGNWWIEQYMYLTIQILLQVDKRTADKIAKIFFS
jgi:hypothetical protein